MPWCSDCDRFYNPNTLNADGTCPTCGHQVAVEDGPVDATPEKIGRFRDDPTPWHFKVLVGVLTIYLSYRAFQGIDWVAHHL